MVHISGIHKVNTQFPESLDECVSADNLVSVIDIYMNLVEIEALGFTQATTKGTGRKPYDPADFLKPYTYDYLNQIRSTRRPCH